MKICIDCKKEKEKSEFNLRQGCCKLCQSKRNKKYRVIHNDFLKQQKLEYRKKNKHVWKANALKKTYGITLEYFNELLESQSHVCACCGKPETSLRCGKVMDLSVDHDHQTGKVRGLLCSGCNTSLGLLNEDLEIILKLAQYIASHKS